MAGHDTLRSTSKNLSTSNLALLQQPHHVMERCNASTRLIALQSMHPEGYQAAFQSWLYCTERTPGVSVSYKEHGRWRWRWGRTWRRVPHLERHARRLRMLCPDRRAPREARTVPSSARPVRWHMSVDVNVNPPGSFPGSVEHIPQLSQLGKDELLHQVRSQPDRTKPVALLLQCIRHPRCHWSPLIHANITTVFAYAICAVREQLAELSLDWQLRYCFDHIVKFCGIDALMHARSKPLHVVQQLLALPEQQDARHADFCQPMWMCHHLRERAAPCAQLVHAP
jgi:hypothetical protein